MKRFSRLKNPGSWRPIAVASWKDPTDPTVNSRLEFDFSRAGAYLEKRSAQAGIKITPTHLVAKAVALSLRKFPEANAMIRWGRIYVRNTVDIFLHVAVEDKSGTDLSGAKVESCDSKSLEEIALELRLKSQNIRKRSDPQFRSTFRLLKVVPSWLLRWVLKFLAFLTHDVGLVAPSLGLPEDPFGSAMVTNVGALGCPAGFAPINPLSRIPFVFCMGEIVERPWVVDHQVVVRPVLEIAISFDHRFLDGATAAKMVRYFRMLLEDPEKVLAAG